MKPSVSVLLFLFAASSCALAKDPEPAGTDLEVFAPSQTWTFLKGTEFAPGGEGSFTVHAGDNESIGVLKYDFTGGGVYVAGKTKVEIPEGYTELRFQVKSDLDQRVGIRLFDESGQAHQTLLDYTDPGNWQELRLDLTAKAPSTFGGAKDGVIHYPIGQIWLLVEKKGQTDPGEVSFKGVRAYK